MIAHRQIAVVVICLLELGNALLTHWILKILYTAVALSIAI